RLKDQSVLRGYLRRQGHQHLQLQTLDGSLRLLLASEDEEMGREQEALPPLRASAQERRDVLAYLSHRVGVPIGATPALAEAIPPEALEAIRHPKGGRGPTYNWRYGSSRHRPLDQINAQNVGRLTLKWMYTLPTSTEMTPLVSA